MKKLGVAILGLGVVGSGTYKILTEKKEYFKRTQGLDITVESVLEINIERARALGIDESIVSNHIAEVVSNPNVDVVCEVIGGVEPARSFVLAALKNGKTVVTSNKELFCKYWHELEKVAKDMRVGLYFEASSVGGVPIIRTLIDGMQANEIQSITGIINGTTNYILTKMAEENKSYDVALKDAQNLGYAEANPTADVDGFDASYKLSILSSLAFNTKVPLTEIYREGISKISSRDIEYGKQLGYVLKLLAIGKRTEKGIEARVHPTFIEKNHPLASVKDSFNAVFLEGDMVGDIMLYGRGAGSLPTASAVVSDVIYAGKRLEHFYCPFKNCEEADKDASFSNNFESKYYIRFSVKDKSGVLSQIAGVFAKYGVNIKDVMHEERENGKVPLLFITHKTKEQSMQKAISKIVEMTDIVESLEALIRVE